MARSKVTHEWIEDIHGISCLKVSCKRGRLNDRDVYECLERDFSGWMFIKFVPVPEEVPVALYDNEGDYWLLYEPGDVVRLLERYSA